MKFCEWCANGFEPKVNYQVYCSSKCREAATKEKVAENYRAAKRAARAGVDRICANKDCNHKLSIYNDSKYCSSCFFSEHVVDQQLKKVKKELK